MYIHADMRGVGTLLLALDGVPVGLVVEADTLEGWVRRYDTTRADLHLPKDAAEMSRPDAIRTKQEFQARLMSCPIVRTEGRIDYVGDSATDPDWMIAQRLVAIRIRHGLPIDASLAHDTSGMVASVLERLASQLRSGSMSAVSLSMSGSTEPFPLPGDRVQHVRTGAARLGVDYVSVEGAAAYETSKAAWARDNPDLVAGHVRSLSEGESRIIEEAQAVATHRMAAARLRRTLR